MADMDAPMADEGKPIEVDQHRSDRLATRKKWLFRLVIVVAGGLICWVLWYALIGRNHVSTDNAYVNAEVAQITPLISAQAVAVNVSDTMAVRKGDLLVRLDPSNAVIAIAQAQADLAEARRRFQQMSATSNALSAQVTSRGADIAQAHAQLASAQAEFDKARIDLDRREALASSGAVSGDELTSARKSYAAARSALEQARAGIEQAQSNKGTAQAEYQANEALVRGSTIENDPGVLTAKAKLESARLEQGRTIIRAPIDGVVTRRQVQVGQRVTQGMPIMMIVPLTQVYVDANFKERQLRRVKIGMPAKVTADLYGGDVVYHGRVAGLSGGTGSSFALIPAQNATGNWIKVVQRVPVRIALDPKELSDHPLRVGLSMEVEIDLSGG